MHVYILVANYLLFCFLIVGSFYLYDIYSVNGLHERVWEYTHEVDSACYNDYAKSELKVGGKKKRKRNIQEKEPKKRESTKKRVRINYQERKEEKGLLP